MPTKRVFWSFTLNVKFIYCLCLKIISHLSLKITFISHLSLKSHRDFYITHIPNSESPNLPLSKLFHHIPSSFSLSHTQIKEQKRCLIGGGKSNAAEDGGGRWLAGDGGGTTTGMMFRDGMATEVVSRMRRRCLKMGQQRRWDGDGGGKSNAAKDGGGRWLVDDGGRRMTFR
ncbi:hypothetical protein HanPI659440_Chr04g0147451 [Helianthus annuus]|nr:hypothetical protein HanPI659440_Chr04g0147451 [Helianthus annuus]